MTKKFCFLTLSSLFCLISGLNSFGQAQTIQTEPRVANTSINKQKQIQSTPEEKLVRAAYEKLTNFNRASQFVAARKTIEQTDDSVLRFELSGFRVGPIKEIALTRVEDLISPPSGEIVLLTRVTKRQNEENDTVSYKAQWTAGQYASIFDPQWSIANLMSFEADRDYDVDEYAAYVVKLSFQGKTKIYRALALFHNPYKFQGTLKPSFWDTTVGLGGTLTDVWNESRPITGPKGEEVQLLSSLSIERSLSRTESSDELDQSLAEDGSGDVPSESLIASSIVRRTVQDSREHLSGEHGQTVGMQGSCFEEPNNQQRCQVDIVDTFTFERGELSNVFFFHSNKVDEKTQVSTGSRGTTISCYTARGIATGNCSIFGCGFTAGLQGSGSSIHMVGGDVWNSQLILTHNCNISSVAGGTCTTPSFDGSCPIGSSPNGLGLCCFTGTASCNLSLASRCFRFGGDYDFETCSCFGCDTCSGSPIVIDINGDGIALSGPSGGVEFDLNGNGTRDRLGWTLANSDDAWLALDRNANGDIDNGSELFGDFTTQPAGPNKNGFLALAEFDKTAQGGNGDGIINDQDIVFGRLRLWQDSNHNGIAEADELHTLPSLNVSAFELDFKEAKRVDQFGNEFRYRGKVKDTHDGKVARWAWDVFLSH